MSHLLPGEDLANWKVGDLVTWNRIERGGYGFVTKVPCVVVGITHTGRPRVRYTLPSGQSKTVCVRPMSLEPR